MKNRFDIFLFCLLVLVFYSSLAAFTQKNPLNKKDLRKVKSMMCGTFDSRAQAMQDSANYYEIHLHMEPIWEERSDGFWLYVEQAMVSALERPYRQRIYHVHLSADTAILSEVYELHKPSRFAGAWKEKNLLANINPDSLLLKNGCAIVMKKNSDGSFSGKTGDKTCPSNLRGASFTSSEVTLSENQMISWDRGFDATGKQVWGAQKGGYIFVKRK